MSREHTHYLRVSVLILLLLFLVVLYDSVIDSDFLRSAYVTDAIVLSAESFLIIITSVFVAVATRYFIMPITLYMRGRS